MKLIVGLGNPGSKYNFTRYNIGFLVLDFYFKLNNLNWDAKPHLGAIKGRKNDVLFIKPQEFYNETGSVVQRYMHYYKIPISNILIICDNFDLQFGLFRYRSSGAAGGNNGLKSIDQALSTNEYSRIRIGTRNDELRSKMSDIDFVLSRFTPEEKSKLPEILREISDKITEITSV